MLSPLSSVPRGSLRHLQGVAFDLDDTLTDGGVVQAAAYAAICSLRAAGLRCVLVTGRPLGWTEVLATLWPIDVAVGENGAGWFWRVGATVEQGRFDESDHTLALNAVLEQVRLQLPHVALAHDQRFRRCDLAFDVAERASHDSATVERLREVIERAGMRATVSSVHVHAVPGGWDKAKGVVRAIGHVWSTAADEVQEHYAFVGDSGNDAAAFSFFRHTFAVANVKAHLATLPTRPRWVSDAARGAGFAEIARTICADREVP